MAQVLLDHLERIFDLALVYHDFYAGALSEHGGPLQKRPALVKQLSEFVIGEEGDAEGYAYPQDPSEQLVEGGISPTSTLELVGSFFYHAHGREQCEAHSCGSLVPVLRLNRVAPLHMRKAFCHWVILGSGMARRQLLPLHHGGFGARGGATAAPESGSLHRGAHPAPQQAPRPPALLRDGSGRGSSRPSSSTPCGSWAWSSTPWPSRPAASSSRSSCSLPALGRAAASAATARATPGPSCWTSPTRCPAAVCGRPSWRVPGGGDPTRTFSKISKSFQVFQVISSACSMDFELSSGVLIVVPGHLLLLTCF